MSFGVVLAILGGLIILTIIFVVAIYNGLITLRNRFKNAFSQIDVQLKRRHDLIPNLVETAKGYLKHERETLEAVMAARNQASQAQQRVGGDPTQTQNLASLLGAESMLGQTLGRLMAVVEAYPDLKADQNMRQVMDELTSTENKIAFARQAFNDAAMQYNIDREKFPNNFVSQAFQFAPAQLWEIETPAERIAPKVSFG
jgi:LemA protein